MATINRVGIPIAYGTAVLLVLSGVLPSNPSVGLFNSTLEPPAAATHLGFVSRTASPLYPLFVVYLILVSLLALANLWTAREQARGTPLAPPYSTLIAATAIAGAGAAYSGFGTWLRLDIPTFPGDLLFGTSILLVGYAVARYAALLEGRSVDRDFLYAVLVVGLLSAVFVLAGLVLYLNGQVSFFALVLGIIGSVAANSILDGARVALDRLFYKSQFQKLRGNLRALAREAGTGGTLSERLQAILTSLCRVYHISNGFIASSQGGHWTVEATHEANPIGQTFETPVLAATESIGLLRSTKRDLPGMTLLIPLYAAGSQVGAVVLGAKRSNDPYDEAELELLEDLGDQIGALIRAAQIQEENARAIDAMVQDFREKERGLQLQLQEMLATRVSPTPALGEDLSAALVPQVEDALRRFHDFSYLGEHDLSKLHVVDECLSAHGEPSAGFVERGKALGEILMQALNQLRPNGPMPDHSAVPPREWHPFIVLHDSYVLDEPNRDIMSRLYIGEGTFNRTRRHALHTLAKSLAEMEQRTLGK